MQMLKQSTVATVLVGPLLDASGVAVTTAAIGDFNLTKNGTTAAMAAGATATHSHNGHYLIAFITGNVDTLGRLVISANNTAHAMTAFRFQVAEANTFDALFGGGDLLKVDVTQFGDTAGVFAAGIPEAKVASIATNAINAAAIADGAIDTATFAAGTTIPRVTLADTVTTNTDMRGTDGANTITPTNLSAAQVRTELATELGRIDASISSRSTYAGGAVASVTAAVELDSASVTAVQSGLATASAVTALNNLSSAQVTTAVLVSQLAEAYAADGVPPTLTQAVMLILQHLSESSIVSTTKTVKKLDGTTSAATFTLDSATDPTSITRTT